MVAVVDRQPVNTNFLAPSQFQVIFRRMPNLSYFCQTVNIPGVTIGDASVPTPFVDLGVPGDKMHYDTFNMTFLVDETLHTWIEMYDWIKGLSKLKGFDAYKTMVKEKKDFGGQYSDATVTVLTNQYTTGLRYQLNHCYPISLSSLQFDTEQNANSPLKADASFKFTYFDIDRIAP